MDVVTATRDYEAWVSGQIPVVKNQLVVKHKKLSKDPVQFLRGTFYRWAQILPEVCPDLIKAPRVLAVGDLHIASFGTWRDGFGRLIWGIDDFDEAYSLPYTNDLVRLAVSAVLDASDGNIKVGVRNACEVILDGYQSSVEVGGKPFVLEENHKWLRGIALDHLDVPSVFWKKMDKLPTARNNIAPEARKALVSMLPAKIDYRVVHRTAGVGSLGHPRDVAVANWKGGQIALEAKAAVLSACAWSSSARGAGIYYQRILDSAVRCRDPFVRLCGKWLVRQLSPDSAPIEIDSMHGLADQDRLLHAMAWETANIHMGTKRARSRVLADLKSRGDKWLRSAVKDMSKAIFNDWKEWKRSYS